MPGPLSGVRVLDLARVLAGPYTTRWSKGVDFADHVPLIAFVADEDDRTLSKLIGTVICSTRQCSRLVRLAADSCGQGDPQVLAREMLVDIQDPKAGPVTTAGLPIKLSATPGKAHGPAPGPGEHTEAVLADWLHLPPDAVVRLREKGVV